MPTTPLPRDPLSSSLAYRLTPVLRHYLELLATSLSPTTPLSGALSRAGVLLLFGAGLGA